MLSLLRKATNPLQWPSQVLTVQGPKGAANEHRTWSLETGVAEAFCGFLLVRVTQGGPRQIFRAGSLPDYNIQVSPPFIPPGTLELIFHPPIVITAS